MKVSAIALSAMLGFTLSAAAQSKSKEPDKPKQSKVITQKEKEKGKQKEKEAKAKNPDSTDVLKGTKKDPDYCPPCGRG